MTSVAVRILVDQAQSLEERAEQDEKRGNSLRADAERFLDTAAKCRADAQQIRETVKALDPEAYAEWMAAEREAHQPTGVPARAILATPHA